MVSTSRARPRYNDDGLTLVEMVVALGILMVVLTASLSVFITVQHSQQTAEGTDRAIQLANSRIERIRQLDWRNIGFYDNTYNTAVAGTDYETGYRAPLAETTVKLGPTEPTANISPVDNRILPYQVTAESRNRFTVYTTITYGRDTSLSHKVVSESWFAPQGYEEAPPGVVVSTE
jgi:type II secretory pathway pseudopilin PulG